MKVLWNWIKEFIELKVSPFEAAESLTMSGIEVESVEKLDEDFLFDINLTANRPDCLSVRGVARELSVIYDLPLKEPSYSLSFVLNKKPKVTIESPTLCPRYSALIIEGVKNTTSPSKVRYRLEACGIRSINAIVDATNYILLETGHPLHAFDLDSLEEKEIIVRCARENETITTLDGINRKLTTEDLVIADKQSPVALAGIMGGAYTEIKDSTVNILLESAYFNPVSIRKTSRRHSLHTEASHRFERGADFEETVPSLIKTAKLITEWTGGKVSEITDCRLSELKPSVINFRLKRYEKIIGSTVDFDKACHILEKLGCVVKSVDSGKCTAEILPPSFRPDLVREIDLIEEICRLNGYDKVPVLMPELPPVSSKEEMFKDFKNFFEVTTHIRTVLSSAGLKETINYSFESSEFNNLLGMSEKEREFLLNPLDSNQNMMRVSLLPGLLSSLLNNKRYLNTDLGFFEIGKIFPNGKEKEMLSILLSGKKNFNSPYKKEREWDFFDLKGIVERIISDFNIEKVCFEKSTVSLFHKGQCAQIIYDGKVVGILGSLSPVIKERLELRQKVFLAELELEFLMKAGLKGPDNIEIERFLPVKRDISVVCSVEQNVEDLLRFFKDKKEISSVVLSDIYKDEKLGKDKMSLTFSISLKQIKKMTEEEINSIMGDIIRELIEKMKVALR